MASGALSFCGSQPAQNTASAREGGAVGGKEKEVVGVEAVEEVEQVVGVEGVEEVEKVEKVEEVVGNDKKYKSQATELLRSF